MLYEVSILSCSQISVYLRLEGGAADDEGTSSSVSRPRFRPLAIGRPRLAADMLGRSGELEQVSHARRLFNTIGFNTIDTPH